MLKFRTFFPHSSRSALIYTFPQPDELHLATIKDRVRSSGLTSVRFVDDDTFIVADFAAKKCYLVRIGGGVMKILDSHDTVLADGTPVETDLIDHHKGRFIVSNFYQGTISNFEIRDDRIHFVREVATGGPANLHGVRFIPGHDHLVWLTFCNFKQPCHKIMNLDSGAVLHEFSTDQQCQDVAFAGGFAVVFARTNHISKGEVSLNPKSPKNTIFATAYVYRLPADLADEPPVQVSRWTGKGHIDACMEAGDGRIFCANQYLDRVDIFRVSSSGELSLTGAICGYGMPHGLDIRGKRLAVTNYSDQTLRVLDLPR